jgi:hypothetical protein
MTGNPIRSQREVQQCGHLLLQLLLCGVVGGPHSAMHISAISVSHVFTGHHRHARDVCSKHHCSAQPLAVETYSLRYQHSLQLQHRELNSCTGCNTFMLSVRTCYLA